MSPLSQIGYADCFSGISGDMFLGALLDCGLDEALLKEHLSCLKLDDFSLTAEKKAISGISCTAVTVNVSESRHHHHLSTIISLLESSSLPSAIVQQATSVFTELARAEAKVHDCDPEAVHFHEVGAVDAINDVVGVLLGLEHLGISRLHASPLPMGRGFVKCEHGTLPLPAPAVCEILKDVPLYGVELQQELVTPTGAALLKVLAQDFGPMIPMRVRQTGYGSGSNKLDNGQPNLFRLFVGTPLLVEEHQEVEVIETNIDDWSPEGFPHLYDRLLESGALDVSVTPLMMKKGRPGFLLRVITPPSKSPIVKTIIFEETSAIGLRFRREFRQTLERQTISLETQWGSVEAKKIFTPSGVMITPEYDACRQVANKFKIPLQAVYDHIRTITRNSTD